ncbi:MAG: hypothetical protein LWX83_03295 [Anaerolineae bacterium]|nr:hypothetical protein [Anaerolineae bacterium]
MSIEFFVRYLLPWLIVISAVFSTVDIIRARRKNIKKWYHIPILVVDAICILVYGFAGIAGLFLVK